MSRGGVAPRDAPPDDDPAAEAEAARANVDEAGRGEQRDRVVPRPEAADARPEEAADLGPARRDEEAGRRQSQAHPRFPGRPPDAAWHGELEHRDGAARPDHARKPVQRRARILDVAQEVRERQRRELAVGERERLGAPLDQLHGQSARPLRRDGEHLGALVERDDRAAVAADELACDEPGAGGDVEHRVVGADVEPRDEEAPPARVLAEGEERAVAVVGGTERREQCARGDGGHEGRVYSGCVGADDELGRAAAAAARLAGPGETLEALLAAEPAPGRRVYLCAFAGPAGRSWLALDASSEPVTSRALLREAVSIAALCELADELAGQGPRSRVATPEYLDAVGTPELASAFGSVQSLTEEVEGAYRGELS